MTDSLLQRLAKELEVDEHLDISTEVANAPSNLGSPQKTSTPIKEQQSVPESLSDSIKFLIESQQRQFQEFQSLVIEEIKSTNARIDTFCEEPATKKRKSSNDDIEIDNLSVEGNSSQDREETKPDGNISILSKLSDKFTSSEKTGPCINSELSKILKSIVRDRQTKKDDEKRRTDLLEKNPRSNNCDYLSTPRVNPEIWRKISTTTRSKDIEFQKTQSSLLRAFGPVAYVLEKLVEKDPKGENEEISPLIESLMDTVVLLSMANDDMNEYRRNNIKPDLHTDYRSLCSNQVPVTEMLFGDNIADQLKLIQEANKVGKKVDKYQSSTKPFLGSRPSWTNGSKKGKTGWGKQTRDNTQSSVWNKGSSVRTPYKAKKF